MVTGLTALTSGGGTIATPLLISLPLILSPKQTALKRNQIGCGGGCANGVTLTRTEAGICGWFSKLK